jgi:Uma2 family endonuclease
MSNVAPSNSNKATAPDRQLTLPEKSHQDYLTATSEHDTLRVEYLNGDIVMTPARSPHHQIIVTNLLLLMGQFAMTNGLGLVLPAPLDVVLAKEEQIAQPDLIFISKGRAPKLVTRAAISGAPDLVLEIISPSTARADRKIKPPLYARYGVAEFWLVDPEDQSVEVFVLDGETYRVAGIYLAGDTIKVGRFADAKIAVDTIFAA